jgi:hypothetical protein
MLHLILTRHALKQPDEIWLRTRIKIFENFCAPSIRNQTSKNFLWVLAVHPNTPEWFIKRTQKAFKECLIVFSKANGNVNWVSSIPKKTFDNKLLTTRLDNDDALHADFVNQVQKIAKRQNSICALDAPCGYNLDQKKLICYPLYKKSNQFISLLEFNPFLTVYCREHPHIGKEFRTLNLSENTPMWIQGINDTNIWNRIRDNRNPISWLDIKHNFQSIPL